MENAILATVTDVIETKTGNTEYRVDTYNVKCVPVETANQYSKALKAGKICKAYTSIR